MLISNILTEQAGDPEFFMNVYFRTNKDGNTPENASGYSNPEYDALSENCPVNLIRQTERYHHTDGENHDE